MAQSTIRLAAGAGVVAASLLIVGPHPAQAVADKHGSGSHSKNDDRKNGSNRRGNRPKPSVPNLLNGVLNIRGTAKDPIPDLAPPATDLEPPVMDLGPRVMDLGTGGSDLEDLAVVQSIAPEGPTALRSAAVVEEPPSVNASGAVPRSGSDHIGASAVPVQSPRVVVGNGRSPGLQAADPEPGRENPVTPEVVPAVPAAIEVTIAPMPPLPPVERIRPPRLTVGEMGPAEIDTMTDPFFGLAGLILIPAIGAALGYRQARAAQSVRESARS